MYLDLYVGDLDDPEFSWEGGDWNGNVPRRRSPFFPQARRHGYSEFIDRVSGGVYPGKQTDWGGWVAKMTPAQIRAFIAEFYPRPLPPGSTEGPELAELLAFVDRLEDGKLYALCAVEL